ADALPARERAWLLERRSYECYLTDQSSDAIDAIASALELYRALGDCLGAGRSLRWLSYIHWCPGRTVDSERTAVEAVDLLETVPAGGDLAMAYANLSDACLRRGRRVEAAEWSERSLDLARRLGDVETEAYAIATLALADPSAGCTIDQSLELAERE